MEKKRDILVFNLNVANDLINRGYPVKKLMVNTDNSGRVVVMFHRSEGLINTLSTEHGIEVQ